MGFFDGLVRRSVDLGMSFPRGFVGRYGDTTGAGSNIAPPAPSQTAVMPQIEPHGSVGPATNDPYVAALQTERNRLMGKAQQVNAVSADSDEAYRASISGERDRLAAQAVGHGASMASVDPTGQLGPPGGAMPRRSRAMY